MEGAIEGRIRIARGPGVATPHDHQILNIRIAYEADFKKLISPRVRGTWHIVALGYMATWPPITTIDFL